MKATSRHIGWIGPLAFALSFFFGHLDCVTAAWEKDLLKDSTILAEVQPPPSSPSNLYKDMLGVRIENRKWSFQHCQYSEKVKWPNFQALYLNGNPPLSKAEVFHLKPLHDKITKLTDSLSDKIKKRYPRKRPFAVDALLRTCDVGLNPNNSYLSSHSAIAAANSCILTARFPDRKIAILHHAWNIAETRMIIAAHFPSDVQAGWALGIRVCQRLLQSQEFRLEASSLSM